MEWPCDRLEDLVTDETETTWHCPKDGSVMQPLGRRSGAWRCPECRGLFIDTAGMRRGRGGRPPKWVPMLTSVLMSMLATFVVRRLRKRLAGGPARASGPDAMASAASK
jgi:hypothetical protein